MFVMSSSSFMMSTFKVACNDDEVVVMHSCLEGYIKSKCSFIARLSWRNFSSISSLIYTIYLIELSFYTLILFMPYGYSRPDVYSF